MRGVFLSLFIVLITTLVSCEKQDKPKVIYSEQVDVNLVEQTTTPMGVEESDDFQIADLPLVFGQSKYLVHPVAQVRAYKSGKYSKKSDYLSFTVSSYVPFELRGDLDNIMFQHVDSLDIRALTLEKVKIQSVTYLKEFADVFNKEFIVYTLVDKDTNLDGKMDTSDVKNIYISKESGLDFIKLNPDYQEVLDWSLLTANARLYFRCVEDVNKNGAFDKEDIIHYYYLDLLKTPLQVESYDPLLISNPL